MWIDSTKLHITYRPITVQEGSEGGRPEQKLIKRDQKYFGKKSASIASHNYYIVVSYFANTQKKILIKRTLRLAKKYGAALGPAIMEHEADNSDKIEDVCLKPLEI